MQFIKDHHASLTLVGRYYTRKLSRLSVCASTRILISIILATCTHIGRFFHGGEPRMLDEHQVTRSRERRVWRCHYSQLLSRTSGCGRRVRRPPAVVQLREVLSRTARRVASVQHWQFCCWRSWCRASLIAPHSEPQASLLMRDSWSGQGWPDAARSKSVQNLRSGCP